MKEKLQKIQKSGRICGITKNNGDKFNGQIRGVGNEAVIIFDRNSKKMRLIGQNDIKRVRCGS